MSRPFRRRSARVTWELQYGPNMTPMVDVVMVILIFFMASATFAGSEWFLKTAIPKQGAAEAPKGDQNDPFHLPPARFELTLARGPDGRTVVSGPGFAGLRPAELPARLKELAAGVGSEDLVLVIRPESGVPYGDVIRAHDAAAAAGIAKVGLMDAPPAGPSR
jgi:biopolymer transport protein ExbD